MSTETLERRLRAMLETAQITDEQRSNIDAYIDAIRYEMRAAQGAADTAREELTNTEQTLQQILSSGFGVVGTVSGIVDKENDDESDNARLFVGNSEMVVPIKDNVSTKIGHEVLVAQGEVNFVQKDLGPSSTRGEISDVSSVVDNRVSIMSEGGRERLFVVADTVTAEIGVGDRVRHEHGLVLELVEKFQNRMARTASVQEVSWDDVGGLAGLKLEIDDLLLAPLRNAEDLDLFPAGVLLHGVPGCGKDLVLRATMWDFVQQLRRMGAPEPESHIRVVHGPELLNEYVGVTERRIRTLYQEAAQLAGETSLPVLVCWSEPEAVLRTRGGTHGRLYDNCVTQWLSITDGLVKQGDSGARVATMMSTNRPDMLDSAVTRSGRIDRRVRVPRPDRSATEQIFGIHVRKNSKLDKMDSERIAIEVTEAIWSVRDILRINLSPGGEMVIDAPDMMSGALIEGSVKRAASAVRAETRAGNKSRVITVADVIDGVGSEMASIAEIVSADNAMNYFVDHIPADARVLSVAR